MSDQQTAPQPPSTLEMPPEPAGTPTPATTPSLAPAAPGPDIVGNFKKLPLAEKIVCGMALLVEIGWVITWSQTGGWEYSGLSHWFPLLSFVGALAVVALVALKVLAIRLLPPNLEKHAIPVASLLPVLGFVIQTVSTVSVFLTVVGSLAMAYVSATTYWRKHMPKLSDDATKPSAT